MMGEGGRVNEGRERTRAGGRREIKGVVKVVQSFLISLTKQDGDLFCEIESIKSVSCLVYLQRADESSFSTRREFKTSISTAPPTSLSSSPVA